MKDADIENLNNQELAELLSILEGMNDELDNIEKEENGDEKND